MMSVAFFRSLNHGHAGSPTGAQLVEAFGGPDVARTFQTNGTVVFSADEPARVLVSARETLRKAGFTHEVVIRTMEQVRHAGETAPPVDPSEGVYRSTISLFDDAAIPDVRLPLRSSNGLVEVRAFDNGLAHSVCWKPRNTAGDVTGFLERLLGVPVTTRTTATIERLVKANSVH